VLLSILSFQRYGRTRAHCWLLQGKLAWHPESRQRVEQMLSRLACIERSSRAPSSTQLLRLARARTSTDTPSTWQSRTLLLSLN